MKEAVIINITQVIMHESPALTKSPKLELDDHTAQETQQNPNDRRPQRRRLPGKGPKDTGYKYS